VTDSQLPWYSPLFYTTAHSVAAGRVGFIEHEGRRILSADLSHADTAMVKAVAAECFHLMSQEPPDSVLVMIALDGTPLSSESLQVGKELTDRVRPYGRRTAVTGVTGLRSFVMQTFVDAARRPIKVFKDRPPALEWLIASKD